MREQRGAAAHGNSSDHAVDHAARRDACSAAAPVDTSGCVEVSDRVEAQKVEPEQQAPQVARTSFFAGSCHDFHRDRFGHRDRPVVGDPRSRRLILASLNGIAMAAVVLLGIEFVVTPLYLTALSEGSEAAANSAAVYSGAWFVARLLFVFLGAGLLGLFLTRFAGVARDETNPDPRPLAIVATSAFAFVLAGEFIGRTRFYESMFRIGV